MMINTIDFGYVRIVNKKMVNRVFDTYIRDVEESYSDNLYELWQLSDGRGSIVAILVEEN